MTIPLKIQGLVDSCDPRSAHSPWDFIVFRVAAEALLKRQYVCSIILKSLSEVTKKNDIRNRNKVVSAGKEKTKIIEIVTKFIQKGFNSNGVEKARERAPLTDALVEGEGCSQGTAHLHQTLGTIIQKFNIRHEGVHKTHGSHGVKQVAVVDVIEGFLLVQVDHGQRYIVKITTINDISN